MDEKCPHGVHTDMTCESCEVEASQYAETVHALAVAMADILTAAHRCSPDAYETALSRVLMRFYREDHTLEPQIAATVARLTTGDGNG